VNRDELAALARGVITVLSGAAILIAIGVLVSWWAVAAIAVVTGADTAWCVSRLPRRCRPW
jgi:hypothetical protein